MSPKPPLSDNTQTLWGVWFWTSALGVGFAALNSHNPYSLPDWIWVAIVGLMAFGLPMLLDQLEGFRLLIADFAESLGRLFWFMVVAIGVSLLLHNIEISFGTLVIAALLFALTERVDGLNDTMAPTTSDLWPPDPIAMDARLALEEERRERRRNPPRRPRSTKIAAVTALVGCVSVIYFLAQPAANAATAASPQNASRASSTTAPTRATMTGSAAQLSPTATTIAKVAPPPTQASSSPREDPTHLRLGSPDAFVLARRVPARTEGLSVRDIVSDARLAQSDATTTYFYDDGAWVVFVRQEVVDWYDPNLTMFTTVTPERADSPVQ